MIAMPWLSGTTVVSQFFGPVYYNSAFSLDNASSTENARLTIYLRVLQKAWDLRNTKTAQIPDPANPGKLKEAKVFEVPDPANKSAKKLVEVTDFPTGTFKPYTDWVKQVAQSFWDNTSLCLIAPPDFRELNWPPKNPTHRLNVDCRFEIVDANGFSDAHLVLYHTNVAGNFGDAKNPFTLRSFVDPNGVSAGGASVAYMDTGDMPIVPVMSDQVDIAGPKVVVGKSHVIWHEFGHALGLPHVGIAARHAPCMKAMANGDTTEIDRVCYKGPTSEDSLNVMGLGDKISVRNSIPWLLRAPLHTGTHLVDWRVKLGKQAPARIS